MKKKELDRKKQNLLIMIEKFNFDKKNKFQELKFNQKKYQDFDFTEISMMFLLFPIFFILIWLMSYSYYVKKEIDPFFKTIEYIIFVEFNKFLRKNDEFILSLKERVFYLNENNENEFDEIESFVNKLNYFVDKLQAICLIWNNKFQYDGEKELREKFFSKRELKSYPLECSIKDLYILMREQKELIAKSTYVSNNLSFEKVVQEISDLQQLKQKIQNNEFLWDKLKELDEKIKAKIMLLKEIDSMKYNLFIMNKSEFDMIFKDLNKLKNISQKFETYV